MTALLPYRLYPRLDRAKGVIWTGDFNLLGRPAWFHLRLLGQPMKPLLRLLDENFDRWGYKRFRQPVRDRSRVTRKFERFLSYQIKYAGGRL